MAGLFFDNVERQERLKDLYGSFNDIRQNISDSIADITREATKLQKSIEQLQAEGKVPSTQDLEAKIKERMTDEQYKEFKELFDEVAKTDHDLWVAWSVLMWVDAGYATVMLPVEIMSRVGAFMVGRALNQAVNAAQVGVEIPVAVQNLAANGARAMRPRGGGFHIPEGAPELARLERLERFAKFMGRLSRIGRIVGVVLLVVSIVLTVVDVIIQDSQRTELMEAITDLFGSRHYIKQLAMAIKSEAQLVTDTRVLLAERVSKENTLDDLIQKKILTAEQKKELMAEYDAKKMAEIQKKSPPGPIPLPSDEEVYKELKARDDLHKSWQKNDPDLPQLLEWLKHETEKRPAK